MQERRDEAAEASRRCRASAASTAGQSPASSAPSTSSVPADGDAEPGTRQSAHSDAAGSG